MDFANTLSSEIYSAYIADGRWLSRRGLRVWIGVWIEVRNPQRNIAHNAAEVDLVAGVDPKVERCAKRSSNEAIRGWLAAL